MPVSMLRASWREPGGTSVSDFVRLTDRRREERVRAADRPALPTHQKVASSAESVGRFVVNSSPNAGIHRVFRAIGLQINLDIRNREGTNLPFFDAEIA